MDAVQTDQLFSALGEQLAARGRRIELVVIGGSGLLALGLIGRPTGDVDIVALLSSGTLAKPRPLPRALIEARDQVARDFNLPEDWLNAAPADLLDFGLPDGFVDRLERRDHGEALTVHLASRFDQIHFKLYAMVDQGAGKHEADLRALEPTRDELLARPLDAHARPIRRIPRAAHRRACLPRSRRCPPRRLETTSHAD